LMVHKESPYIGGEQLANLFLILPQHNVVLGESILSCA
jgi:hypothetical protein